MPTTDTNLNNLIINKLTRQKYNELALSGLINDNELYFVTNTSIDAANQPIANVGTPVNSTDAANKAYVDSHGGGDPRYNIVTPATTASTTDSTNDTLELTLEDRSINIVDVSNGISYVNMTFPEITEGKARDFFLRLIIRSDTVPEISFMEESGADVSFDISDEDWASIEQGVNLIMFTETSQEVG